MSKVLAKKKKAGFWANVKEIAILLLIVYLIRTFGFGLFQVPTGSMETTMLVGERFFADKLTPWFSKVGRGEIIAFDDPLYNYSENKLMQLFQEYVWGPTNWTKRVIGIPGDTVEGKIENGKPEIYVNGKKLDEPYLNKYPLINVWTIDQREIALRSRRAGTEKLYESRSFDPDLPYEKQVFYRMKKSRVMKFKGGEPMLDWPGTPRYPSSEFPRVQKGDSYWTGSDEFYVELGQDQYWVMGDNRRGSTDSRWFGPIKGRLIHSRIMYCVLSLDTRHSWLIVDLLLHPIDFWRRLRWSRFPRKVS